MDFREFLEEDGDEDVEKGESVKVQTEESVLRDYVRKKNVIGRRW
jgi:hypothetical protein